MKISDIIKSDNDRLFIVDLECFIIYTGEELNDIRPFIRIGTWSDLPIKLIPLIENIIITDSLTGWPSQEQFNIDVRNFHDNRYIGKESALNRFLKYQQNFGLDLTNVTSVNVEKDIPELQEEKNLSKSDHFVGIFYSDGNIHIRHRGDKFFDLYKTIENDLNFNEINEQLSLQSRECIRYSGAGFVILDKNPLFFCKNFFTSYQCHGRYFDSFSRLAIDPNKIRELILPSENLINISPLLKLKNSKGSKLRIFSNNQDQVELIKKLYNKAVIVDEKFNDTSYNTGDGLKFETYHNTPNIKLLLRPDNTNNAISIGFAKSPGDVQKVISDNPDVILITYTAFENSVLLFKSSETPILIIDDGNQNISKVTEHKCTCLLRDMQYDIHRLDSLDTLIDNKIKNADFKDALNQKNSSGIENIIKCSSENDEQIELFNYLSAVKSAMMETSDRNFFNRLNDIYIKYHRTIHKEKLIELNSSIKIDLYISGNSSVEFISGINCPDSQLNISDSFDINNISQKSWEKQNEISRRINEDRIRLNRLIDFLYANLDMSVNSGLKESVRKLEIEINRRKEIYGQEIFIDNQDVNYDSTGSGSGTDPIRVLQKGESAASSGNRTVKDITLNFIRRNPLWALMIIIAIIAAAISFKLIYDKNANTNKTILTDADIKKIKPDITRTISVIETTAKEKEQIKNYNIKIRSIDIYRYANDVAKKNGYAELSNKGLEKKNPHWIYPTNIFVMLDGENVTVRKGDTLWALSKTKLEKMSIMFHETINKINLKNGDKADNIKYLSEASVYAYLDSQKEILNHIQDQLKNGK